MTETLKPQHRAMISNWARHNDIYSKALVYGADRATLIFLGAPAAAAAANVHAALRGDAAANKFPGPIGAVGAPRNVSATFGANWDGGDIKVTGVNHFGETQTEVLTGAPGTLVAGTKVWAKVTSIEKTAVGVDADPTNTVTIGTDVLIGVPYRIPAHTPFLLFCDSIGEAGVYDYVHQAITTTTAPDGTKVFMLLVNLP
jgi:hypothetical protein